MPNGGRPGRGSSLGSETHPVQCATILIIQCRCTVGRCGRGCSFDLPIPQNYTFWTTSHTCYRKKREKLNSYIIPASGCICWNYFTGGATCNHYLTSLFGCHYIMAETHFESNLVRILERGVVGLEQFPLKTPLKVIISSCQAILSRCKADQGSVDTPAISDTVWGLYWCYYIRDKLTVG